MVTDKEGYYIFHLEVISESEKETKVRSEQDREDRLVIYKIAK